MSKSLQYFLWKVLDLTSIFYVLKYIYNIDILYIFLIMNTKNFDENTKVGKRLAADQVKLLREAIEKLLQVAGYVNYEDEVEQMLDDIEQEQKALERGDTTAVAKPTKKPTKKPVSSNSGGGSSGGGGVNWSAAAGETIIGNLARGEGGRFVSASNITKMMGILDRSNISAGMFSGLNDVLAGKEIDPEIQKQLQAAGMLTEDGKISALGNDVVKAVGSGNPDNLKAVITPKKPKSANGRGEKPKKPPKPTKEEKQRANIIELKNEVVNNERLTNEQYDAFVNFMEGSDVDKILLEELETLGLVEIDKDGYFRLTDNGDKVGNALQNGNLREALDTLSVAKEERVKEEEEEAKNIDKVSTSIVKQDVLPESDMNSFLQFVENIELSEEEYNKLNELGLVNKDKDGNTTWNAVGNSAYNAMLRGATEEAVQKIVEAREVEKQFGLKVLEGEKNSYLLTWTTNSYRDRENEFFKLESIKNYVERNAENKNKGVYQFWHTPGSEFADIVWQGVSGKFLVEIGRFRNDEMGKAFKQIFKKFPVKHEKYAPDGWGCSHGFHYIRDEEEKNVYKWFDKKETTVLPLGAAANSFTLMEVFSE